MSYLKNKSKKISFIYLLSVPIIVTALAFAIGHVNCRVYIPLWLLNILVMAKATRTLSKSKFEFPKGTAFFFVFPWMLFAIFAGMGPPPETAKEWATNATEQIFRYSFLIAGGISVGIGFYRLSDILKNTKGSFYAQSAKIFILIALPLFILNMSYWGYFLTNIFITYSKAGEDTQPLWIKSVGEVFTIVRMIEVALFYFASAALACALMLNKQLSKTSSFLYIFFTCLAAVLNILPTTETGLLALASYLSYIPAFTLLAPYLIAVNLLTDS